MSAPCPSGCIGMLLWAEDGWYCPQCKDEWPACPDCEGMGIVPNPTPRTIDDLICTACKGNGLDPV